MKMQQLQKKIEQVTEQNVVSTKIVDKMSNNLKMVSETLSALKKESKILKDESGQPQIRVLGARGKLKRDNEELKSKI